MVRSNYHCRHVCVEFSIGCLSNSRRRRRSDSSILGGSQQGGLEFLVLSWVRPRPITIRVLRVGFLI